MKHGPAHGALRRRLSGRRKVGVVMGEFKRGTLHSGGSGRRVTNPKQAVAIAMSEAGLSRKKRG